MRLPSLWFACLTLPLLAACVNDGATYEIDNTREHVLSVIREQPYFWDSKVNFYVIVSRMPACMRRHDAGTGTQNSKIEIYQVPSGAFIVKIGKRMFATETQTCESFAKMSGEPAEGMGVLKGTFREKNGTWLFEAEKTEESESASGN